jgi:hypothetical protein
MIKETTEEREVLRVVGEAYAAMLRLSHEEGVDAFGIRRLRADEPGAPGRAAHADLRRLGCWFGCW